jgi:ubiquinone/menaquinone biosynthesis C-methylase UbiE
LKRSYDTIALYYDRLAKLVYGKALIRARSYLVSAIAPNADILIVGGGTGRELEEIASIYPTGINITYIDASAKMISRAAKRNVADNKVTFMASPVEASAIDGTYDIILTPFFFDNFTDESMRKIFARLHAHLRPGGLWLYCDFLDTGIMWQKAVLSIMYLFFRRACGIEARRLPDAAGCFSRHGYSIGGQQFFLHNFITAVIYKKEEGGYSPS